MKDSPLAAFVSQRLDQAGEALEEAGLLAQAGHPRGSVNRSYYAMFYSVQALLAQAGLRTSKHSGAIALFDREFVKKGRIEKEFSRNLHRLFDLRQDSDYGDMFEASAEKAKEVLEQARLFVERARSYLEADREK